MRGKQLIGVNNFAAVEINGFDPTFI